NPPDATEQELKTRTLTNLYNTRPMWLHLAHTALDRAVLDAYGWSGDLSDSELLERLFALNRERAENESGSQMRLPEPSVVGKARFSARRARASRSTYSGPEATPSPSASRRKPA